MKIASRIAFLQPNKEMESHYCDLIGFLYRCKFSIDPFPRAQKTVNHALAFVQISAIIHSRRDQIPPKNPPDGSLAVPVCSGTQYAEVLNLKNGGLKWDFAKERETIWERWKF